MPTRAKQIKPTILICGAGIAGCTLAYWLNRYGFHVTVLERAAKPRPGGQAIDVRGAALQVAERMGIGNAIRRHRTRLRGMSIVDDEGTELSRTTERTASGGDIDGPDVEILRDDLAEILLTAAGGGIEYLFGDRITALVQHDETVQLRLHSGAWRSFDLVIGADGLHSDTRRLVFGPEQDYLHHLGSYLGVWTVPNYLGLDRWEVIYQMPDTGLWGVMVMSVRGNTEARVYIGIDADEPPGTFLPHDITQQKRLVAQAYDQAKWETPRLLEQMWHAADFHFDAMAQIHLNSWSHGRVALLGDAGYCASPASGQGTTMAMVGAYVLAGELKLTGGEHRTGFRHYEHELREFVTANQELALTNRGEAEPAHGAGEFAETYKRASALPLKDY